MVLNSLKEAGNEGTSPDRSTKDRLEGIHPKVRARCGRNLALGQYDDAIFNALKALEEEIRFRISGTPEDIGVALVSKAMSPKNARLIFSGVIAEQEAYHSLYRGAIGVFKNPLSHRFLDITDELRANEILGFVSLLMKILDEAKDQISEAATL
jgi:uncharacterized protein (TIGR02391 family)